MTDGKMEQLDAQFDKMERYTKVRFALREEGYNSAWRTYVPYAGSQYMRIEAFIANSGPVVIVQQFPNDHGIEVYRPITDDPSMDALLTAFKELRPQVTA